MRIIAGKFKGKKLAEFNYDNIRPTSDIVKEAVFNVLQFDVEGSVFLDLFGGSGSVGLEALSRGAQIVVIADASKDSVRLINKNNELLGGHAKVMFGDHKTVLKKLSRQNERFDIIFLDPPYDTPFAQQAINIIVESNLLAPDGVVVCEHHKALSYDPHEKLEKYAVKNYGIKTVEYLVWRRHDKNS